MMGVYTSNSPMPGYWRLMSFIDGENLVFCYQSLLKEDRKPNKENEFIKDVFVWNRGTLYLSQFEILKATLYTYAIGSDQKIGEINKHIRKLSFNKDSKSVLPNNITPCVFKKNKKNKKTKGVDIKMTVDILSNVYNNNLDVVLLVAGDGDYLPIVKEAKRLGKLVYLAFFTKGLNENLLNYVDQFICLDKLYFDE